MPALSEDTAVKPTKSYAANWQIDETTVGATLRSTSVLDRILDRWGQTLNYGVR